MDTFLAALEAEKSKIKALADSESGGEKPTSCFIEDIFSLCPHMAEVARDFSDLWCFVFIASLKYH